ncbi:MAG: hypothetical protein KKD31_12420 [Bacteroidetes bacterium]|nr:hypothetical protein [Bacteroidota bacterium]
MTARKKFIFMLLQSDLFLIGAILTLIPSNIPDDPNEFGYFSLCPWTPYSTITLVVIFIALTVRAMKFYRTYVKK